MSYRPQEHAAALADSMQLQLHLARELAALHGKVDRLLHATTRTAQGTSDTGLDQLVQAAFDVVGSSTWSSADLVGKTLESTAASLALLQAIEASSKLNPRSLGKYLTRAIPNGAHTTTDGLEIRRSGLDGNVLVWTIAIV
ncbi:MAG: hypothetical protein Q7T69_02635 [Rhodoferax sp.]|nr:hypothetical protein [Rhodoferax sp.]